MFMKPRAINAQPSINGLRYSLPYCLALNYSQSLQTKQTCLMSYGIRLKCNLQHVAFFISAPDSIHPSSAGKAVIAVFMFRKHFIAVQLHNHSCDTNLRKRNINERGKIVCSMEELSLLIQNLIIVFQSNATQKWRAKPIRWLAYNLQQSPIDQSIGHVHHRPNGDLANCSSVMNPVEMIASQDK